MSIRPSELDGATVAFRRLLDRANGDEQARVDALLVLGQRRLFAPTWSTEDSGIRTLTNAAGETAMPLFTGDDTLQAAAVRFKWLGPDGMLSFRELPARQAIRHALATGVHFVVLDIGSPHVSEFVREELAPLLTAQSTPDAYATDQRTTGRLGEAVRRSTRPPRPAGESFPPPPPAPPATAPVPPAARPSAAGISLGLDAPFAELDSPFKRDSPAPAQRDRRTEDRVPVVVRSERPFAPLPPRAERPVASPVEPKPVAPPVEPRARRESVTGVARRVEAFPRDDITQEVPSVPPRKPSEPPPAVVVAPAERKKPSLADRIAAVLPDLDVRDSAELPALDAPALAPVPAGAPARGPIDVGGGYEPEAFQSGEMDLLEARPEALEAAALVTELARSAGDADAREAAAELAEMLKLSATGAKLPGEDKPKSDAAGQLAAMLLGGAPGQGGAAKPAAAAASASAATQSAVAKSASTATQRAVKPSTTTQRAAGGGLRRPEVPLSDELVDLLADKLRGYPEVEWACEASDGGDVPVVGLRVDPSFLSRVAEITDAILSAGKQRGTVVSVVLLTDPEKMKRARNLQTVFFPGRRRGVKK